MCLVFVTSTPLVLLNYVLISEVLPPMSGINGTLSSIVITGLSSGYEYSVSVTPVNILGEGTAMTETVVIPGTSNVKLT